MNYQESLDYIHSLLRFGIKPGLERVEALLSLLGNPQDRCRYVHIAGTNGKGSTSTMLAAMLRSAGLKTGLYTSPYVSDFRERMQINGEFIPKDTLCELTGRVKQTAQDSGIEATEFEFITALAFLWFAEQGCDIVVLETGLGGRYDATNVIKNPIVSVITPIGLDHTAVLGPTIEAIAGEKAGIIKNGCPCVAAFGQPESVKKVLEAAAREKGSDIVFGGQPNILENSIFGSRFEYCGKEYKVGMMGRYQVQNAVTAITAAGFIPEIGERDIANGLAEAFIPARMEIISRSPLALLDGGHNGHAAKALKSTVEALPNKPVAVIGMMEDKDISDYAAVLGGCFSEIITVKVQGNPRTISAEGLAKIFSKYNKNVSAASDYADALQKAGVGKRDVMVCGSLYLAGAVRPLLLDLFR